MIKCTLAQVFPPAATLIDAYRVPVKVPTIITNILICNHQPVTNTFSLAFAYLGDTDNPKQYWFKNTDILPNETIDLDIGLTLNYNDVIRIISNSGNISFNILGAENRGV